MYKVFFGISLLYLFSACAPARFVKPLDKNQQAINLSLGGPLIEYGDMVIPMPLITAAYGYGIDSTLTGFGAVNITSALYGNLQLELGVTKQLLKQNNKVPAISITPIANIIYRDKDTFKFYPQLDLSAFWEFIATVTMYIPASQIGLNFLVKKHTNRINKIIGLFHHI